MQGNHDGGGGGGSRPSLASLERTEQVEYAFECAGHDASWVVASATVQQALNEPYRVELDLRTGDLAADGGQLLGQSCSLSMTRGTVQHRVSGIVAELRTGSTARDQVSAQATVVPALWGLSQQRDTRIFQNQTVPEILQAVLEAGLAPYQREVSLELERTYPKCEYRVQYDETTLSFVTRLMEEEGIAFWFDQEGEQELLVLADTPSKYREVPTLHGRELQLVSQGNAVEGHEGLREFHLMSRMSPTAVVTRHFDWTHPSAPLTAAGEAQAPSPDDPVHGAVVAPRREVYDHDARALTLSDFSPTGGFGAQDGAVQAALRYEAIVVGAHVAAGVSTALGMTPGSVFELLGHALPEMDGRYVVLSVVHHGLERGGAQEQPAAYYNELRCIPAAHMARPERSTPKPRVGGIQTATVVGPAGSEIHTDEHGRIRVQFHWDRIGARDEHASCYLRVMQPWAGAGWGFVFLPRIGMEVTVAFLDGDPDRPLVTGSVYNADNPTPHDLPREMTKSTIRTRSSPTPAEQTDFGYNELTFEDKAGAEEVFLRAEKDLTELVKNDHTTQVNGDQANIVVGTQSVAVGMDRTLTVGLSEVVTIGTSRTETVGGAETIRLMDLRDVDVLGSDTLVVHGTRDEEVHGALAGRFRAGRTVHVEEGDTETVADSDKTVTVGGAYEIAVDAHFRVKRDGTEVFVEEVVRAESPTQVELVVGGNSLRITSDGKMVMTALTEIELVCGDARLVLKSDGTVSTSGSTKVELISGGSAVVVEPAKVASQSTQVDIDGSSVVNVKGGTVNLNG